MPIAAKNTNVNTLNLVTLDIHHFLFGFVILRRRRDNKLLSSFFSVLNVGKEGCVVSDDNGRGCGDDGVEGIDEDF